MMDKKPEELRFWADQIADGGRKQPTNGEIASALEDYAELYEDMKSLVRILHKWGD
jgi:hypothetical protein